MKSIIFFMLLGLSFFSEGRCDDADLKECLTKKLQTDPELLKNLISLTCLSRMKEPNQKDIVSRLSKTLNQAQCVAEDLPEQNAEEPMDTAKDLRDEDVENRMATIEETLEQKGVTKRILDYICQLDSEKCLKNIMKRLSGPRGKAKKSVSNANQLMCEAKQEKVDIKKTHEHLESLSCVVPDSKIHEALDAAPEEVIKLIRDCVKHLSDKMMTNKTINHFLGKHSCKKPIKPDQVIDDAMEDLPGGDKHGRTQRRSVKVNHDVKTHHHVDHSV